ncbi:MAG: glycoside hydrolase family 127 protein, partial [Treponema sp.]|jgi:DUF1680 family protein|nr:glycoside hydrolase family 127 protein [Treponema sp.]
MPGGPLMYHTPLGKNEDIITSERFFDQDYWMDAFIEQQPLSISFYPGERPHCYDLLALEALADEYRATGNRRYLDALLGGWQVYVDNNKHTGGAPAICETGGPYKIGYNNHYPPKSYYISSGHTGELCGNVFWIWVNHRLMQLFPGEEKYVYEIEESLYNTIIPGRTAGGGTWDHNRLQGERGDRSLNGGGCCEISSVNLVSSLPEYIYMTAASEIYVNLFIPSVFDSPLAKLRMETRFPQEGAARIIMDEVKGEGQFVIKLRIPGWAAGPVNVSVNGETFTGSPGAYLPLNRRWKAGDVIAFDLSPAWRLSLYTGFDQDENNLSRYAILYGPVLMALTGSFARDKTPRLAFDPSEFEQKLRRRSGLVFDIEGCGGYTLKPYFEVHEGVFNCCPIIE